MSIPIVTWRKMGHITTQNNNDLRKLKEVITPSFSFFNHFSKCDKKIDNSIKCPIT